MIFQRRLVALTFFLLFSIASIFSLDGYVTWYWYENDSDVKYYRYQVDKEDENLWTVVSSDEDSVSLLLDITTVHTLYLQQSYDGITWSESSLAESFPFVEEETFDTEPLIEEPIEQQVLEDEIEKEETYIEVPKTESVVLYDKNIKLDFALGYLNTVPDLLGPKMIGLNASYSQNIKKYGFGDLGIRTNLGFYFSKSASISSNLNCLLLYNVKVGNCDVFAAIGPDITLDKSLMMGLCVQMGIRYNRVGKMAVGMILSDHQYFTNANMINKMEIGVFTSKSF